MLARILTVLVAATALAACKKKTIDEFPQRAPPPVAAAPPAEPRLGTEGASCVFVACNAPLVCAPSQLCRSLDSPEMVAIAEAARVTEKKFLAQSGVKVPTTAEQPPPTAPPPTPSPATGAIGAVRAVTISNEGKGSWTVAACTSDERLVGGSCEGDVDGYPTHHTATDTIGARWNCGRTGRLEQLIIAHALCQRIAPR